MANVSIALLLRLGRPGLALMLWQAPESKDWGGHTGQHDRADQWLNTALTSWLGAAFRRLESARERGDDREALDVSESLVEWGKTALATWKHAPDAMRSPFDTSFLKPVPDLLEDARRRLGEPHRDSLDSPTFRNKPQAERISELLDRLEDAQGAKLSIPGSLDFSFDPAFDLLVKEEDAGTDALLEAYEHDHRLTRTMDYSRPWMLERWPVSVSDAAKEVLATVLNVPDRIRNAIERNFAMLADDRSTPEEWLTAADTITLRSDFQPNGSAYTISMDVCTPGKPAASPYGEVLRTRKGPNVAELLTKRTIALASSRSQGTCQMGFMAYRWEPKTSLPALQAAAQFEPCRADKFVMAARLSLGDTQAASDWVPPIGKMANSFLPVYDLAPLWMFPTDPVLEQIAEWLFDRPDAPLSPARQPQHVYSPLLALHVYRRAVFRALEDASVIGSATRSDEGRLTYRLENFPGGSDRRIPKAIPDRPIPARNDRFA
jgi:hypothetical protein